MRSDRRKVLQLNVKLPDTIIMLNLLYKLPPCFKVVLEGRFGKILELLTVKVQVPTINVLTQFYDPPL